MNNELQLILDNAISQLNQLESNQVDDYNQAKEQVIKLQKQLLSASVLQKENLADKIKVELKAAELKLFELTNVNRELELAFLTKYIKENYE